MGSVGTSIAELFALVVVVVVIVKYVVPPIRRIMRKRQDLVRNQVAESLAAHERLRAAERHYREALDEARAEAARIRDDARADAQRIGEEMKEQARREVERIRQRGEEQLASQHQQIVRELRTQLGAQAAALAERMVRESLADERCRSGTVDAFLGDLEGMQEMSVPEHSAS